jgi:Fur family ferric uptake transcriptional regulator
MCRNCDYAALLESASMTLNENRLSVLEAIGNNSYPLSAADIFRIVERHRPINRVTVYRILDLLVEHGLVERLSTGGRSFYYGLAPNAHHQPHPHFYCQRCGQMDCLNPDSLVVDTRRFSDTFAGKVEKVEVRLDGVCKNCMR